MKISYGKLRVPVHRIAGDDVLACDVSVEVLGENFLPAYTEGDNSQVVATDTMKNFIVRESLGYDGTTLEGLLLHLRERFLDTYPVMESVRMSAKELRFDRLGDRVYSLVHEMGTRLLKDVPEISEISFTAENHTRDPVGEEHGRKVYTDPFPAQGLITLTLP